MRTLFFGFRHPAIDRSRPKTVFRANDTGDGASGAGANLQSVHEPVPEHSAVRLLNECLNSIDVRIYRIKTLMLESFYRRAAAVPVFIRRSEWQYAAEKLEFQEEAYNHSLVPV